jgi:hypothetical protein
VSFPIDWDESGETCNGCFIRDSRLVIRDAPSPITNHKSSITNVQDRIN